MRHTNGQAGDDLSPLANFGHASNGRPPTNLKRRQAYEQLAPLARQLVVCVTESRIAAAHELVDDMALAFRRQTRVADLHLSEAGVKRSVVKALDARGVHTVEDLAYSNCLKLMLDLDLVDVAGASFAVLRKVIESERERLAAPD